MEEHVGMIANNPNYKLEELEKQYNKVTLNPMSADNQSSSHPQSPEGHDDTINPHSAPATAQGVGDVLERHS